MIHSWSVPAGKEWSCPGESEICGIRCYTRRGFFRMQNVKESYARNFEFASNSEFVPWAVAAIQAAFSQVVRIHVSGDFKDVEYTRKWQKIVAALPDVTFFAYTRSWRIEEILPELLHLHSYPNMRLWWSVDRATGPAPRIQGIRHAYMAISDADARIAPPDCDLVFRDKPDSVMKKAGGGKILVCPTENGVKTQVPITCSRCQICWRESNSRWEEALLPEFNPQQVDLESPHDRRRLPVVH